MSPRGSTPPPVSRSRAEYGTRAASAAVANPERIARGGASRHRPGCESAVDGAALVGVRERVGELARDVERVGGSKRSAFAQHPVQRLGVVEGLDQVIPLRLLSEVQHRHDVVVPEPDRPPDGILDERELRGIVGQRRGQDGHGEEVAEERVPGLVRRPRRAVAELLQHLVPAGDEGVALPRRGFDSSVVSRSLHAGWSSADAEGQDLCQGVSRKGQVGRKRRAPSTSYDCTLDAVLQQSAPDSRRVDDVEPEPCAWRAREAALGSRRMLGWLR